MKKLILLGFVLSSWSSQAELIVTKKDGGLFGYKSVSETIGEGRHTLNCTDPGRTRCKAQMLTVDGTLTLTEEEFEVIDATVASLVADKHKESGSFNYANKCLISFKYNPDNHLLIFTVYSIEEATKLNLI
jgi:hypothetical protein